MCAAAVAATLILAPAVPAEAGTQAANDDPVVAISADDVTPLVSPELASTPSSTPSGTPEALPVEVVTPERQTESTVKGFDADTSELVAKDESSTVYKNADGTFSTILSTEAQRVENAAGAWVPASTKVMALPDGGGAVSAHPLSPQFASAANSTRLLELERHGVEVQIRLIGGRAASRLERHGSEVEYEDVMPGTDLTYEVTPGSVKESVVLASAPRRATTYRWKISGTGFTVRDGLGGSIELVSTEDGSVAMTIPPAVMVDSSGKEGVREPATVNAPMTIAEDRGGWVLTVAPDLSWLQSPDRVYPVSVDPTVQATGQVGVHAYKSDGTVIQDGYARIGNSRDNGDRFWRSMFTYNYTQFAGSQVLDAQEQVGVVAGTVNGYPAQTGWAKAFAYDCVGTVEASTTIDSGGTFNTVPLTQMYATWVAGGGSGNYVHFTGYEAGGLYTYKKLASNLVVTTAQFPTAALTSPGNGARTSAAPTLSGSFADPGGSAWMQRLFRVGTTPTVDDSAVYDSGWVEQSSVTLPAGRLAEGKTYYWKAYVRNAWDGAYGVSTVRASGVWSFTTNSVPAVNKAAVTIDGSTVPSTGTATIVTTWPSFAWPAVTPDSDGPVQYMVRIATGGDATTGTVLSSGWQSGTSFQVPEGSLTDGGVYSWTILTKDPLGAAAVPWTGKFLVNRRLAESGPSPVEQVGPVTVNLANGNGGLRFASPTVSTVGGPMGLSFSYNSQASRTKGLLGRYYAAGATPSAFTFPAGTEPLTTRIDPSLSFSWGTDSPSPSVPVDQFAVRWTGFLTVPTDGQWTFGVVQDDGVRVKVGTTTVLDRWSDQAGGPNWGSAVGLSSTTRSPIQVDYYENGGGATFQLWAKGPGYPDGIVVPSDWLSPTFETLPAGWSASSALAGEASAYVSASVEAGAVVVTDETGTTHTYTRTSAGGYTPPSGEYGVLGLSSSGQVNLTDSDGTVYVFGANGRLESATSPEDAKTPATPKMTWRAGTGQLDAVTDRASGRKVSFYYAGDTAPEGSGAACPAVQGFAAPPAGNVCRIVYPSATGTGVGPSTYLHYDTSGRLVRIVDPGTEVTDFQYAATGELTGIRTPAVNDWLAADTTRVATDASLVQIAYTSESARTRKVASVTLPAADGVTAAGRLSTTFGYTPATGSTAGKTVVDRTGITGPTSGHSRTVTYDRTLRQLSDSNAAGLTSSQAWDTTKDLVYSSTDQAGRMSTTVYDVRDRVTDTYGPAPAACFGTDRRPLASCPVTPAHTSTAYDQGMQGLSVAFYSNPDRAGQPAAFALGIGATMAVNWGTNAPNPAIPAGSAWSARMTGVLNFPAAGSYTLSAGADDVVRVWIDDQLVLAPPNLATNSFAVTRSAAGPARIRVDYANTGGPGSLNVTWSGPGISGSPAIPATALEPDFGLVTSTKVDDSAPAGSTSQVSSTTTATEYGSSPWLGHPETVTEDAGGLSLTTTTRFEAAGVGFARRTGKWLPAATAAGTLDAAHGYTYSYYAATDVQPNVCGAPAGALSTGLLKTVVEPTPAGGSPVSTAFVYDQWGRMIGTKKAGDDGWTCVTYDERGRVTKTTYPSSVGTTRTVTTDYAVGGDPLTSSTTDSALDTGSGPGVTTATSDLLGRGVRYTDVWGVATSTTFDAAGRPSESKTTAPGGATYTTGQRYDIDGNVVAVTDGGAIVASPAYSAGELAAVAYPTGDGNVGNGTSLTIGRDPTGSTTSLAWSFAGGVTLSDQVARSQAGRVLTDTVTDGASVSSSSYSYDGAGRLVKATIPHHELTYEFAGAGGCGVSIRAGMNGNRTGVKDVFTSGATTTTSSTTYCYDSADRLTATTVTNPVTDANPVAGTNLSQQAGTLAYDARGNTTALADQTLTYDASNRHLSTSVGDTTVAYQRDASDRIVARKVTTRSGTSEEFRYGFTGRGDSPDMVLNGAGDVVQRTLALPGGVVVSLPADGSATWSYPNVHGDVVTTADATGTRGAVINYDPFGQVIDPTAGAIGTVFGEDATPDNQPGTADNGWVGSHQKLEEHATAIAAIEMGARAYLPALGRFLSTDPVEGGLDNDYTYPGDPIGDFDLSGKCLEDVCVIEGGTAVAVLLAAVAWVCSQRSCYVPIAAPLPRDLVWPFAHKPKAPAKNGDRDGHGAGARGSTSDKHTKAQGHGGAKRFTNPNKRKKR